MGYHPVLRYGEPAFVYQSQTSAAPTHSFSGAFFFGPEGTPLHGGLSPRLTEVAVPPFKFSSCGHLW